MKEFEMENLIDEDFSDENDILINQEYYNNSVDQYFEEISKYKLLTEEEEKNLFVEYKNGNIDARKKLIESNLRFVVYIVKRYFNRNEGISMTMLDLIQEGNLSLFKAVDTYSIDKNVRFTTYAAILIKRDILRAIHDFGYTIRIPVNMREEMLKIKKYRREFLVVNGCYPTRKDLIKHFGYSKSRLEEILIHEQNVESLSYPLTETSKSILMEIIIDIDSDKTVNVENKIYYENLMKNIKEVLTPKEYDVFINRILSLNGEKTLAEIASRLGISQERVRVIEMNALNKIKRKKEYRI